MWRDDPCPRCGRAATTAVVTTWPVPPRPPGAFGTAVTLQGWSEGMCDDCAYLAVAWPPPPAGAGWRDVV